MKRRDFVSMLIGASTAAILVPKRVFSLPPPMATGLLGSMNPYLTSKDAWYLKTEHPDGLALYTREHPLSNNLATPVDLSEEALEHLCIDIRKLTDDRGIALTIRPTRRIVSPAEYHWIMGSSGQ